MANIKKSFNFRNGVQVDDDNLKVSATGLVGIGTTVPTEALDVRGNLVVSGVSSAVTAQAGVLTVTTLNPTEIIGAGISIKSGIVTASSGIITFYGDGINLLNLPTSQWEDTIVGSGVSSIYNTGGNVGIATTAALFTLQVGNDVNSGQKGVGISSFGDVKASGIITATTFSGVLSGNVTGNLTGLVNSTGISTFSGINATGRIVGAATSNVIPFLYGSLNDLPSASTYHGAFAHVHATGKGYFAHAGQWWELVSKESNGVIGNGSDELNVKELETDQINVTGVSTFVGVSSFFGDVFFPEKVEGSTGFERLNGVKYNSSGASLEFNGFADATFGADDTFGRHLRLFSTTSPGTLSKTAGSFTIIRALNTNLGIQCGVTSEITIGGHNAETIIRISPAGAGIATIRNADIPQQLTALNANVTGIVTAAELNSPLIGVGTITPANEIQVRKSGNAEIQVTSDTGIAALTVGRETGTGDTNNAEFRYGGGSGTPYSSAQSLDILNYGTGNFNYHLSANNAGAVAGDFHWHKGKNNARLMTLTNAGRLGIGVTQPTQALDVAGNVKIRGTTIFDDIVTIQGGLNVAAGSLTVSTIAADITGNLAGNVNATSGLSTFFNIKVTDPNNNFAGIGIKTDNTGNLPLDIFGDGTSTNTRLFVTDDARVGIKTDELMPGVDINAVDSRVVIQSMGVGTTNPQSAVDMRFAGQELTGIFANRMYMYPPQVTTTQRGNLAGVAAGALIYNTSTNKLQVYNGSAWQDCN